MGDGGRDLTWDAMSTASQRLSAKYGVAVRAARSRRPFRTTQGFSVPALELFVAVRVRPWATTRWREVVPVAQGAAEVGRCLRARSLPPAAVDEGRASGMTVEADRCEHA